MGGKLIQKYGFIEKRLPRDEYFTLVEFCRSKMGKYNLKLIDIPTFFSKSSFGDFDALLLNNLNNSIQDIIQQEFNPKFIHSNGGIFSFEIDGFQVDFITVGEDEYEFAKTYFSYSDTVGNLWGRFGHRLGMRLGWEGLRFTIREEHVGAHGTVNSHVLEECVLTKDPRVAWEYLGADFNQIQRGFHDLEDAFWFTCQSKYFNPDIFSLENLNHINRIRNRKRENYMKFINFVDENRHLLKSFNYVSPKMVYIPMLCDKFPILRERLEYNKEVYKENQEIRRKFNGDIVSALTGLKGSDLGKLICHIKKIVPDYRNWVKNSSEEEIRKFVLDVSRKSSNVEG